MKPSQGSPLISVRAVSNVFAAVLNGKLGKWDNSSEYTVTAMTKKALHSLIIDRLVSVPSISPT